MIINEYEIAKRDSVEGITNGKSSNGTYVKLDCGVQGFMPGVFLTDGLYVTCSVTGIRKNENFAFLGLDAVTYDVA